MLHKAIPGLKWSNLEGSEPIVSNPAQETPKIPDSVLKETTNVSKAPAYPTSSKTGPKNWDTLLENEREDEDGGVDEFFKKLYKDASPDVQRAMMKSYQESNGTSLSTNWDEVGKKTVETHPPEGMEAKPWGT
jgi:suppressor of G2 allele of SKP1